MNLPLACTSELEWVDRNPQYYEGPLHRECVKRNIVQRYLQNQIVKGTVLYVKNPEKPYQYLGQSIGAGWSNGERLWIYRDPKTGQLFHRVRDDFKNRMEHVKPR